MASNDSNVNRRRVLKTAASAGFLSVAGCTGQQAGDSGDGDGESPADDASTPTVTPTNEPQGKIKIGFPLPFTGDFSFLGPQSLPGAQMVLNEVNDGGGIDGRELTLIDADTEGNPNASISVTRKLINTDQVHALIGYGSFTILQVRDIIQDNQVPTVTVCATTMDLDPIGGESLFRTWPSDSLAGVALALLARFEKYNQRADNPRLGIMSCQETNCTSFIDPVTSAFENLGGSIAKIVEVSSGSGSYQSEMSTLANSDPDAIALFMGVEDSVKVLDAAFQIGYEGPFVGNVDHTTSKFSEQAPEEMLQNVVAVKGESPGYVTDERMNALTDRYKEISGGEAPGVCWTATYDAANAITLAMKAASMGDGLSRVNIAENIQTVSGPPGQKVTSYTEGADLLQDGKDIDFQGIQSNVNFTENGNVVTPFKAWGYDGRELQELAKIPVSEIQEAI